MCTCLATQHGLRCQKLSLQVEPGSLPVYNEPLEVEDAILRALKALLSPAALLLSSPVDNIRISPGTPLGCCVAATSCRMPPANDVGPVTLPAFASCSGIRSVNTRP